MDSQYLTHENTVFDFPAQVPYHGQRRRAYQRRDSFITSFVLMITPVSPRLRTTRVSLAPSLFSLV